MPKKAHWNYRLVRRKVEDEVLVGIYEVHYDDGKPTSCTTEPVRFEVADVAWLEKALMRAFSQPVLDYDQFTGGGDREA